MKKIYLFFCFILIVLAVNAQDTLKLYKEPAGIIVERAGISEINYNPNQTTYYVLTDNAVTLYDKIRGYSTVLIDTLTADAAGNLYGTLDDIILFLEHNLVATTELQDADGVVNDNNPLPTNDIDGNNRQSLNTLFGDKITGTRITSIAAQFQYGVEEGTADVELENGGTVVLENSLLKIISGANPAGRARIQSTETVRYVPGQELYCFFTAVFDTAVIDSYQRVGLYDDENGFFVGYEDTTFIFTRRRDAVDFRDTIDLDAFNEKNGYVLNTSAGNIYRISYGYLGFAPINLEIMKPNGSWAFLKRIEYPNSSTVTHTTQTFLPVRGEVANTGNSTNLEVRSGSLAAGITDGGGADIAGRQFTYANSDDIVFSDSATLVTFRNKPTFAGIENRVPARLLYISGANTSNKRLKWRLLKNPTLEASPVPVWVDVNTNNSTLEYSLNAVANYSLSPDLFFAWNTAVTADFLHEVEKYVLDLPPGAIAAFVIYSSATNAEADLSIRWSEQF